MNEYTHAHTHTHCFITHSYITHTFQLCVSVKRFPSMGVNYKLLSNHSFTYTHTHALHTQHTHSRERIVHIHIHIHTACVWRYTLVSCFIPSELSFGIVFSRMLKYITHILLYTAYTQSCYTQMPIHSLILFILHAHTFQLCV